MSWWAPISSSPIGDTADVVLAVEYLPHARGLPSVDRNRPGLALELVGLGVREAQELGCLR
jgi:hypothetical protein